MLFFEGQNKASSDAARCETNCRAEYFGQIVSLVLEDRPNIEFVASSSNQELLQFLRENRPFILTLRKERDRQEQDLTEILDQLGELENASDVSRKVTTGMIIGQIESFDERTKRDLDGNWPAFRATEIGNGDQMKITAGTMIGDIYYQIIEERIRRTETKFEQD